MNKTDFSLSRSKVVFKINMKQISLVLKDISQIKKQLILEKVQMWNLDK